MDSPEELERRRQVVVSGQTDFARWQDLGNFSTHWDRRAELAGRWLPPGATVLDLGCGRMALERHLPAGAVYVPSDIFPRDERTLVCNLNVDELPVVAGLGAVSALGVLEYVADLPGAYRRIRALNVRFVTSYHPVRTAHPLDRPTFGWMNSLTLGEWLQTVESAGFQVRELTAINAVEYLIACDPDQI